MSGKERRDVQAQSTVEAIRMASASVLGATTGLGYPVGSAIGTGSMLEQHSESVSMSIAPLIFSIRDELLSSEGLELLSIEWNLDHTPGPEVLPDQLVIAGGSEGGIGSHVCVLAWEKGVVDPFKIDTYIKTLSKKLGDIESVVISNEMNYELEGMNIIQRFADRLNSVLFVDMLDRRFKGSWDSLQIKPEHMALETLAKMEYSDDFTLIPPGMKITRRKKLDFRLPKIPESDIIDHFQHRVLTPSAIQILTQKVPETGQSILAELNTYAYAIEEADIAEGIISVFKDFLQKESIALSELDTIKKVISEFIGYVKDVVDSLESLTEKHASSGKNLTIEKHKEALLSDIDNSSDQFTGIRKSLACTLLNQFMKSIERESIGANEVRAWQLRSALNYAAAYAKKVAHYLMREFDNYLIVSAAKNAFLTALRDFRRESVKDGMDSTNLMLFEKFYTELESQINASFSKKSYKGIQYTDFIQLMDTITRELIESFKHIDVWNLIDFSDVAEIARSEIIKKHSNQDGGEGLTSKGKALMELLSDFQSTVSDIIPNVADTILSKTLIRKMIEGTKSKGTSLSDELASAIETAGEKSDQWRKEAISWVEGFQESVDTSKPIHENLLVLIQYVHELLGEVVSPSAMADRVKAEADAREAIFKAEYAEWQETCNRLEHENELIRENNQKRDELIADATRKYEEEMAAYEHQLREYEEKLEQRRAAIALTSDETTEPPPVPSEPIKPSPLEPRLERIKQDYPLKEEKQFPVEPQPEPSLHYYVELRDLLYDKLTEMKERQTGMEEIFARRVLRLQAEGIGSIGEISINISDDFLNYLMDSRIRRLSHLLPRVSRVFLRDPKTTDLLYLVSYEHHEDDMSISIGSTTLR